MYTISHGTEPLFDPRLAGYALGSPTLKFEANRIPTLTFDIYPGNPEYANIACYKSLLYVYRDGTLISIQQPVQASKALRGGISFTCEDILGRLNRFNLVPTYGGSGIVSLLNVICTQYNSHFSDIPMAAGSASSSLSTDFTYTIGEYITGWKALEKHLFNEDKTKDGFLAVTYTVNGVTLNYYAEADLPLAQQAIELGKNMVDAVVDINNENFFTVLLPLGKEGAIVDKKSRNHTTGALNISSVNDGSLYLIDDDAVTEYGWIEHIETFSDEEGNELDDPEKLLEVAQEYMEKNACMLPECMTFDAIDLHHANVNVQALPWPCRIPVKIPTRGINATYPTRTMTVPLGAPNSTASAVQIGTPPPTLTEVIYRSDSDVQDSLHGLNDT